jgi:hypothetical protein
VTLLLIAFFSSSASTTDPTAEATDDGTIVLTIDGTGYELSRHEAVAVQEVIGDALTTSREFVYTACTYREDGSYVVSRRSGDSSGNAKVFDTFDVVTRLFDRLPGRFGVDDVARTGITGSRRHLLVRHFAEHPAFSCRIVRRSPLIVEKCDSDRGDDD